MTQPPIVPGPGEPYEQQPYQPPVSPPPQYQAGPYPPPPAQYPPQPQPVPVYQVGTGRSDIVGKTAISTIVVVATLIIIFCVLPMGLCLFLGGLGSLTSP